VEVQIAVLTIPAQHGAQAGAGQYLHRHQGVVARGQAAAVAHLEGHGVAARQVDHERGGGAAGVLERGAAALGAPREAPAVGEGAALGVVRGEAIHADAGAGQECGDDRRGARGGGHGRQIVGAAQHRDGQERPCGIIGVQHQLGRATIVEVGGVGHGQGQQAAGRQRGRRGLAQREAAGGQAGGAGGLGAARAQLVGGVAGVGGAARGAAAVGRAEQAAGRARAAAVSAVAIISAGLALEPGRAQRDAREDQGIEAVVVDLQGALDAIAGGQVAHVEAVGDHPERRRGGGRFEGDENARRAPRVALQLYVSGIRLAVIGGIAHGHDGLGARLESGRHRA
jgi:hypothetical protein